MNLDLILLIRIYVDAVIMQSINSLKVFLNYCFIKKRKSFMFSAEFAVI